MGLFKKATMEDKPLKIAIAGVSGVGKTYTALSIATGLCKSGKRICVIDTEKNSASMYAKYFDFDTTGISNNDPREYVKLIKAVESEKIYDVLIIDSASHEYEGTGGMLEMVSKESIRLRNPQAAWNLPTLYHKSFIDAIMSSSLNIICTLRSKKKYETTEEGGKKTMKVMGMEPICKDGFEFEFDLFAEMDTDNNLMFRKCRLRELTEAVVNKPGKEFGQQIKRLMKDIEVEDTSIPETKPVEPTLVKVNIEQPADDNTQQVQEDKPITSSVGGKEKYLPMAEVKELFKEAEAIGFSQELIGKVLLRFGAKSPKTIPASMKEMIRSTLTNKSELIGL